MFPFDDVIMPILVRQLFECLTVCQMMKKKLLYYSQDNGLLLSKLVRHKMPSRDLFPRWSQAAICVFQMYWRCRSEVWLSRYHLVYYVIRTGASDLKLFVGGVFCYSLYHNVHQIQLRHNERHGVSSHWCLGCFISRLFRRRSKKTSKIRVPGLYEGNSPVTCNTKGQ